jgi:hypothetical protein
MDQGGATNRGGGRGGSGRGSGGKPQEKQPGDLDADGSSGIDTVQLARPWGPDTRRGEHASGVGSGSGWIVMGTTS